MGQLFAALDAGWRVLLVGLVLGAGLPTVFALGVRSLAWGTGGEAETLDPDTGAPLKPHPLGRAIAYTLFTLVLLAALSGIAYIVAHGLGYTITFNGVLPVITGK